MRASSARHVLLRACAVLLLGVAALVGGVFYAGSRFSPESISAQASAWLRRKSGLDLAIGEIRLTWTGNAELRSICVRNPVMRSPRCFISADIVRLDLRLLPLLRRQLEIRGAQLDNCELNLFTETTVASDKKPVTHHSWPRSVTPAPESPDAGDQASPLALLLDNVSVRNAVVAHESPLLPIPLGRSELSLALKNKGERLTLKAQLPDGSKLRLNLTLAIRDFLATGFLLAAGPRLAGDDQANGELDCEPCNLSAWDSRAAFMKGKVLLQAKAQQLHLAGEGVRLTTRSAYAPELTWTGDATLALPAFYPISGEGSLAGQGLAIQYRRLGGAQKTGAEADFTAQADLGRMAGLSGMKGSVVLEGSLRNRVLGAGITMRNFSTVATGFPVGTELLSGTLVGSRLTLRKQTISLAGNPAEISLDVDTARAPAVVQGSIAFAELNLKGLLTPEKTVSPAQAAYAPGTAFKLKANLRLSAGALVLDNFKTGQLIAQLGTDGNALDIGPWQLALGQGRVQGNYRRQANGQQSLDMSVSEVRAQNLYGLPGIRAKVYGSVHAGGKLAFRGSSLAEVLKTGTGELSIRIGTGKISDSFLQKGVLSGPLHKLEEKFSDVEFASAQAELRLNPGRMQVQRLYFDAEEWNVTYRAECDANGQGKAALAFRFRSSFVENVANPLHMGISGRKDGDFYDLPFACRGAVLSGDCYQKNW